MKIDASEYVLPVNKPLNEAELQVINVLVDKEAGINPGAFRKAMIEAIAVADEAHRFWAHEQMPELVDAVLAYQLGNLYQRWEQQQGKKDAYLDDVSDFLNEQRRERDGE